MSCKSNLYAVNTVSTSILANGELTLPTLVRRYGCAVNLSGNTITLNEPGYYLVNVSTTFTAPDIGDVVINLLANGSTVPGGTASTTISTAATQIAELSISSIVRVFCGSTPTTLSLVNAGVAITSSNIAVNVVKIA